MDYNKHYGLLIYRAKCRELEGYVEKHHIHPRCLGGSNDHTNIAVLTAEEHYLAHLLLVKMYPDNVSLAQAAHAMGIKDPKKQYNNRSKIEIYGWVRRRASEAKKKQYQLLPQEVKDQRAAEKSRRLKGRVITEDWRRKLSEARLAGLANGSIKSLPGNKNYRPKPETIEKLRAKSKAAAAHRIGTKMDPAIVAKSVATKKQIGSKKITDATGN